MRKINTKLSNLKKTGESLHGGYKYGSIEGQNRQSKFVVKLDRADFSLHGIWNNSAEIPEYCISSSI